MKISLSAAQPMLHHAKRVYLRYEKYAPVVSFVAGFSWDNATLSRIDRLSDNIILLVYILLLGFLIVMDNLVGRNIIQRPFWHRYKEWYPLAIQFLFGGLFSAYVIFYSQSASFGETALFLIFLAMLMLVNEFLRKWFSSVYFEIVLYFLAWFSFLTFFLPVIIKTMNDWVFLAGGVLSLAIIVGMIFLLYYASALKSREQRQRLLLVVGITFGIMNLFYWMNWIPPVPLSLKHGGIYHRVERTEGKYRLMFEKPRWYQFLKNYDETFHYMPGDTVFCFTAVFAPSALHTQIYHHWQKYDADAGAWVSVERLSYPITGGRDSGYRGYTFKRNMTAGDWRVEVRTANERLLSAIKFTVVPVEQKNYQLVEMVQ